MQRFAASLAAPRGALAAAASSHGRAGAAAAMASSATFASADEYLAALGPQAKLPKGFRVGTHGFAFRPRELPEKPAKMTVTLIALDAPTPNFAAMFTSNAFPGAPVLVGRQRLAEPAVQAVVVNNKISNVCAPGGVEDSEAVCAEAAKLLGLASPKLVIPSSTGVIG
jgi:glutamate N-acetyltransferase / amino-acid N-acetyltransferase